MTSPERADWQEMAWPVSNRSCYTDCTHTGMPGLPAQLSGTLMRQKALQTENSHSTIDY